MIWAGTGDGQGAGRQHQRPDLARAGKSKVCLTWHYQQCLCASTSPLMTPVEVASTVSKLVYPGVCWILGVRQGQMRPPALDVCNCMLLQV